MSLENMGNSSFDNYWDDSDSTGWMLDVADRIEDVIVNGNTFYGLPAHVGSLILKYKGIEQLYDWQKDCLSIPAISQRQNLLYSLPTSGGKTLVAEILLLKEIVVRQKNVIFILPYVALAQEKVRSLAPFGLDLEFYVEEYVAGRGRYPPRKHAKKRSVYVCTTEKAAGLVDSLLAGKRLDEIGMIVVDEVHLIGDVSRGTNLEIMLSKLMFAATDIQIVAMSATIGNLNEVAEFLGAQVYTNNFRPVELIQYVKCEDSVYRIVYDANGDCHLAFERTLNFNYSDELLKIDPAFVGGLVLEIVPRDSCLVFCATKKSCDNTALMICRTMKKSVKDMRKAEKLSLLTALREEGQGIVCPTLKRTIPYGVAYHHAGLTSAERKLLEEAFMVGIITCICCTSTLAAGLNLPAKRVIITSPYVGKDFLKLSSYKQMSGRAGRTGLTNVGESFLLCERTDRMKILSLLKSTMDNCTSRMNFEDFMSLSMSVIGHGTANTVSSLTTLFDITLFQIQRRNSGNVDDLPSAETLADKSIKELISRGAIKEADEGKYELSSIASAAVAANFRIEEAYLVRQDLEVAVTKGLMLFNYLHLFYLLTPHLAAEEFKIDREATIAVFSNLSTAERKVAEHIGITEVCLIQFVKHGKVTVVSHSTWTKFIHSLITYSLWNKKSIWDVSKEFNISRGSINNFLMRTAAYASSVQRFTEALKIEALENFPALIQKVLPRLSYCCNSEFLELMQLPAVKIGRAKQLYSAGYRNVQDVVNATPKALVSAIDHLSVRVAYEIIAAAKLLMLEKADTLQEEADLIKAGLKNDQQNNEDRV